MCVSVCACVYSTRIIGVRLHVCIRQQLAGVSDDIVNRSLPSSLRTEIVNINTFTVT